jgi:hypothetical protein
MKAVAPFRLSAFVQVDRCLCPHFSEHAGKVILSVYSTSMPLDFVQALLAVDTTGTASPALVLFRMLCR